MNLLSWNHYRGLFLAAGLAALLAGQLVSAHGVAIAAGSIDFSRDIQPMFAKRCVACHGPATQEAGLRLDQEASATAKLDSGSRAIVPGERCERNPRADHFGRP